MQQRPEKTAEALRDSGSAVRPECGGSQNHEREHQSDGQHCADDDLADRQETSFTFYATDLRTDEDGPRNRQDCSQGHDHRGETQTRVMRPDVPWVEWSRFA